MVAMTSVLASLQLLVKCLVASRAARAAWKHPLPSRGHVVVELLPSGLRPDARLRSSLALIAHMATFFIFSHGIMADFVHVSAEGAWLG